MAKISLLAALAFASVCSALEVFTDYNFNGDSCLFATPSGECTVIPEPCYVYGYTVALPPPVMPINRVESTQTYMFLEQDVVVQVLMKITGYIFHLKDNYAESDNLINVLACDPTCIPGTNTSDHK
ncbi:MAG: hypothetical protein J3Q66DRAFT_369665 [Benniella sp.]|nr:MAG: hypothetical protein J3Q66DRAFT_369665 [Benniella sp.]